jgi:hypothetical protein
VFFDEIVLMVNGAAIISILVSRRMSSFQHQ